MSQLWRTDNGRTTESEDRAILKQNSQYLVLYHIPNLEQTTYVFDNICTAHFTYHQTPRRSMQSLSFTLLLLLCDMCPPRLFSVSVVFFLFRNSRILLIRFIFVWQGSLFTDIHHLKTIVITYVFKSSVNYHIGTCHTRGIPKQIRTYCPIPDLFRTIFGTSCSGQLKTHEISPPLACVWCGECLHIYVKFIQFCCKIGLVMFCRKLCFVAIHALLCG